MNPAQGVKRGAEGRPVSYPGFGHSGKSFLIDNLLGNRGPPLDPAKSRDPPSAPRTLKTTGRERRTGAGPPQITPKNWRYAHMKGLVHQPHAGFSALPASRSSAAFLAFCGGSGPYSEPPAVFPKGSNLPLWSPESGPRSRKGILRRAVFSEEQRKELERTFRRQKYIGKADRNKLAADLRLKESQVKIWFQNQRMKWRNCKEKEVLCGRSSAEEVPVSDQSREEAQEQLALPKVGESDQELETAKHHELQPFAVSREQCKNSKMPRTESSRQATPNWTQQGNSTSMIKSLSSPPSIPQLFTKY